MVIERGHRPGVFRKEVITMKILVKVYSGSKAVNEMDNRVNLMEF